MLHDIVDIHVPYTTIAIHSSKFTVLSKTDMRDRQGEGFPFPSFAPAGAGVVVRVCLPGRNQAKMQAQPPTTHQTHPLLRHCQTLVHGFLALCV